MMLEKYVNKNTFRIDPAEFTPLGYGSDLNNLSFVIYSKDSEENLPIIKARVNILDGDEELLKDEKIIAIITRNVYGMLYLAFSVDKRDDVLDTVYGLDRRWSIYASIDKQAVITVYNKNDSKIKRMLKKDLDKILTVQVKYYINGEDITDEVIEYATVY